MSCSVKIPATPKGGVGCWSPTNAVPSSVSCPAGLAHKALSSSPGKLRTTASLSTATTKRGEDAGKLLRYIDDNLIGKNGTFLGPFGRRKGTSFYF